MRSNFNESYMELLKDLYVNGHWEINKRTGVSICALYGAYSFKIDLSDGKLPVAGNRKYWPKIAAAETAWQFMGTKSPEWICKVAPKLWSKFVEDGMLKAAYGYRWRHAFGRDQLVLAIEALQMDSSNRQVYISSWDPRSDGLGNKNQPKNIPCPVGFTVSVVNDRVHMSVMIRSSDVFVGLPYDVMTYSLTLQAISTSLGKEVGTIHFTLAHPHFYNPHKDMISECLTPGKWLFGENPVMPMMSIDEVVTNPDVYIEAVEALNELVRPSQSTYSPLPELIV